MMSREPISVQGSKVLVVDDTAANIDLLRQILESDGYDVSFATNGKQALEIAAINKPDLILLDIMMPEMDGIETCRQLKSLANVKEIPVVFITAKTDRKDVAEGFRMGAVDYICKPVQKEEVSARVLCHLKSQALVKARDDLITQLCDYTKKIQTKVVEQNKQLQQNEKLAAIGAMVGEFTHEISTPVGIAVTALSHNLDGLNMIKNQYDNDTLDEKEFSYFVENSLETLDIASRNLRRMMALVKSFKSTTVNQCHDVCRKFDLEECLSDVVTSLQPRLKHSPHTLTLECKGGVLINSYPGTFAQIVINFVNNSLLHAFKPGDAGEMLLQALQGDDSLVIRFTDNGCGIPRNLQEKIFEKFYTTKLGHEGSGLGLHIVRTLVQDKLHGTVVCYPKDGGGSVFEITLPSNALK
ncbi:MAG: DNA-binding response OmpR family regulator/two-component sensor histidine kinase [Oleiphilaceae bacterium]|jgi:DNA-binding response OmpR family regulator/two-component sensor histidine kinase